MIIIPPLRLKKKPVISLSAARVPLVLVSALYSVNDASVMLTFNRAIDLDLIDTHAFKVYDGVYANQILDGATYSPYGSDAVIISFDPLESYSSTTCTMTVTSPNGIKDQATGDEWAGVTGYELTTG